MRDGIGWTMSTSASADSNCSYHLIRLKPFTDKLSDLPVHKHEFAFPIDHQFLLSYARHIDLFTKGKGKA